MIERIQIEFKWFGPAMPVGSPLTFYGKRVGRLLTPAPDGREYFGGAKATAEVDADVAGLFQGDGSGYGFPQASFLVSKK